MWGKEVLYKREWNDCGWKLAADDFLSLQSFSILFIIIIMGFHQYILSSISNNNNFY
jgi:hypothetical protein